MKEAHSHLATNNTHFNVICELLIQTLQEAGVEYNEINIIKGVLEGYR
jgi:hypothetical protein